ncbi:winged helix-turn-helix transcriptional regulator [Acinetobacter lactucae]|uniref:Helix-turn-helix domain-containing protein n=1 Tax=Acinetobacter lactucae TaxID=1785128 RepID=A0AB35K1Z7_9GAMM|nr:helix-turn-helix domain-containing protein [Acinetobacter lactucae]MDD9316592.1 helix-turn-helix domain-containing protein [Acinetobacter lactucae]MDD9320678.1 helix-turn-helix domain-containing protein [Acinetobacter lactucae]
MANTEKTCEVTVNGKTYPCHISMAMDLVGGKWKCVILYYLKDKPKRFNEIKQLIPTITEMTLSLQLKQLEQTGLISRTVYGEKAPIKVVYEMTDFGKTFRPVLDSLYVWAHSLISLSED